MCLHRTESYDKGDHTLNTSPPRLYCTDSVLGQIVVVQLQDLATYFAACDVGVQGRFYGSKYLFKDIKFAKKGKMYVNLIGYVCWNSI